MHIILRLYGNAKVIHPRDPGWAEAVSDFPDFAGSRQIFDMTIDAVQTSCGTGVPIMTYQKGRLEEELDPFFAEMGPDGVRDYWARKNAKTIDGFDTGILNEHVSVLAPERHPFAETCDQLAKGDR